MLPAAGIVNVAAVDCDEHKSIAGEHGVQVCMHSSHAAPLH
jgi:thioredoxin-like negative regulator of GroEL